MMIQRVPTSLGGLTAYSKGRETMEGEPPNEQPMDTLQRVGCGLAGAVSGAVVGAGSGLYVLRHAPVIFGDILSSGFHEYRSGLMAEAPGNPLADGLRDCANAALLGSVGIPLTALFMAGQLAALPLLFAVGGAYVGAAEGLGPCQVTRELVAGGRNYDDWWISGHEQFLQQREADKAFDAEHGRG
jgi:hypothetical protein